MATITIKIGRTLVVTCTVRDKDGVIFPLTGYSAKFYAKTDEDSDELIYEKDGTIDAPATGVIVFSFTYTDTYSKIKGVNIQEIVIYKADKSSILTVEEGVLRFEKTLDADPTD